MVGLVLCKILQSNDGNVGVILERIDLGDDIGGYPTMHDHRVDLQKDRIRLLASL